MATVDDDTASESTNKTVEVSEVNQIETFAPSTNILHDYPSYTYNLSLHALSPDEYNQLILNNNANKEFAYVPQHVLVAGAGRRETGMPRDSRFTEDFYFDEFKMSTVIGMNTRTRMTNAIDISFTLIEPYGVTFLNRIVKLCKDEFKCLNHTALPYVLQIDFFGYHTKTGEPVKIPGVTKYIPIKIIAMKIKVSSKGATYQINAIPFNHIGFNDTTVHSPVHFQVEATTIGDFFFGSEDYSGSDASNVRSTMVQDKTIADNAQKDAAYIDEQRKLQVKIDEGGGDTTDIDARIAQASSELSTSNAYLKSIATRRIQVKSYVDAFNGWLKAQEDMKLVKNANRIQVEFLNEELRDSPISFPESATSTKTSMDYNKSRKSQATGVDETATEGPKIETKGLSIPAGTSTVDVIANAVMHSKFIRDQFGTQWSKTMTEEEARQLGVKANQSINWFKITPVTVIHNEFDELRNEYPVTVKYQVQVYETYQAHNPQAPQGIPAGFAKYYFYMFTGQNSDVLDFDIDYDAVFYMPLTANKDNVQKTDISQEDKDKKKKENIEANNNDLIRRYSVSYLPSMKPVIIYTAPPIESADPKDVAVKDAAKNILATSKGDMINLNLKILGDPDFIKQDDLFYTAESKSTRETERKTTNGSLIMDKSDIHALVVFRTPVDYNENGLAAPVDDGGSTAYSTSIISGVFKILTVDSVFKGGSFTQTLQMVRLPRQEVLGLKEWLLTNDKTNERPNETRTTGSDVIPEISNTADVPISSLETNTGVSVPNVSSGQIKMPDLGSGLAQIQSTVSNVVSSVKIPNIPDISKVFNGVSFPGSIPNLANVVTKVSDTTKNIVEETSNKITDVKNWATRNINGN